MFTVQGADRVSDAAFSMRRILILIKQSQTIQLDMHVEWAYG